MGASSSVIPQVVLDALPDEMERPLDGSDVASDDTGAAAFAEVQRMRALIAMASAAAAEAAAAAAAAEAADLSSFKSELPPDLKAHLAELFNSADTDGTGHLEVMQFWDLLDRAGFDLNDEEKATVLEKCDAHHDGIVTWETFTNWVTMKGCGIETDEPPAKFWIPVRHLDGQVYFFNKFSGTTAWVIPGEEDELEEEKLSGDMTSYLAELFLTADVDGSGTLSSEEFWAMLINDAQLLLQPEEVQAMRERADFDADGVRAAFLFFALARALDHTLARTDLALPRLAFVLQQPHLLSRSSTHTHALPLVTACLRFLCAHLPSFLSRSTSAGSSSSPWRKISSAECTKCVARIGWCRSRSKRSAAACIM